MDGECSCASTGSFSREGLGEHSVDADYVALAPEIGPHAALGLTKGRTGLLEGCSESNCLTSINKVIFLQLTGTGRQSHKETGREKEFYKLIHNICTIHHNMYKNSKNAQKIQKKAFCYQKALIIESIR